jgi:hypothetical protein
MTDTAKVRAELAAAIVRIDAASVELAEALAAALAASTVNSDGSITVPRQHARILHHASHAWERAGKFALQRLTT